MSECVAGWVNTWLNLGGFQKTSDWPSIPLKKFFTVCVHPCGSTCMWDMRTWEDGFSVPSTLPYFSYMFFLSNPGGQRLSRLAKQALGSVLSVWPELWSYRHTPPCTTFQWVPGIQIQVLMFMQQADWAISQAHGISWTISEAILIYINEPGIGFSRFFLNIKKFCKSKWYCPFYKTFPSRTVSGKEEHDIIIRCISKRIQKKTELHP